jgi:RNA polymerase sigma-70 factor, ECF subfamily
MTKAINATAAPKTVDGAADPNRDRELKAAILDILPNLRAFARSLASNPAQADDLVQDSLLKALGNLHRFETGTNLRAWLFTILRNTHYSHLRKRRREIEDADGIHAAKLGVRPTQDGRLDLEDFKLAFAQLSPDHREVLTLVGAMGMPYEEAAEICGCAVGTVKSRANRARVRLAELLGFDDQSGQAPADALPLGVISSSW